VFKLVFMKRLQSILTFKCPRCLKGDFYHTRNFYDLKQVGVVKKCCSNCGLKYSKETGFYFGAMYVSYALAIALMMSIFVATLVLYPDFSAAFLISALVIGVLLTTPILYALSKIIWLAFFQSYDKRYATGELKDDTHECAK
jgi:uncharacterized protein (DUF983 family)